MSRNIVKAKLDIIFKKIFGTKGNEDVLSSFLSGVLEIPQNDIGEIKIKNTEMLPEQVNGKFSRMDLAMKVKNKMINIEIQLKEQADFNDRTLFYWSKLYSGELKSGDEYGELKETICINIINFNMFDCSEYHSHFKVMEKIRHEILSEKFAIHFFELKKINRKEKGKTPMELWLQFINAETQEDLDMLKTTEIPEIQKAVLIIEELSEDEKIQEIARLREKQMHDEATALGHAKREGIAEGKEKGRVEGINQMIEAMRKNGIPEEQIQMMLKGIN